MHDQKKFGFVHVDALTFKQPAPQQIPLPLTFKKTAREPLKAGWHRHAAAND